MALLFYAVFMGFLYTVPKLPVLNESVRNLHFHVPMWFAMYMMLFVSMIFAIRYLAKPSEQHDAISAQASETGLWFGVFGIITGMLWARFTWGDWWSGDPKQNCAAIALLIYAAYSVLRNSIEDEQQRAKISAVYNIFAFATLFPLLYILPRMSDTSLHPGSRNQLGVDPDSNLRLVFWPAAIGWTLLAWWITSIGIRIRVLHMKRRGIIS
ncbi:MAG: cytochrome c biogenesis protein CcsA [Bacteroidota bacterium]